MLFNKIVSLFILIITLVLNLDTQMISAAKTTPEYRIEVNDFIAFHTVRDVGLNEDTILNRSNYRVRDKNDNLITNAEIESNLGQVSANLDVRSAELNMWVSNHPDTVVRVLIIFYDDTVDIVEADEFLLRADNFELELKDFDVLEQDILKLANIRTNVFYTNEEFKGLIFDFSNVANKIGSYNIRISSPLHGPIRNVRVIVKDENTIINYSRNEAIHAKNFFIHKNDVAALNNSSVINNAEAFAFRLDDNTRINLIQERNISASLGSYNVSFSTTGSTQRSIRAVVLDDHSSYDVEYGEVISASSFIIDVENVKNIDEESILNNSKAKAFKIVDNSSVSLVVDYSKLKEEGGGYEISISTASGFSKKIFIIVKDENTTIDENHNLILIAHDFSVNINKVSLLNDESIIKLAQAQAFEMDSLEKIELEVDYHEIQEVIGRYEVKFMANDVEKIINSFVTFSNFIFSLENEEVVTANDVAINIKDFDSLNSDFILNESSAKGFSTSKKLDLILNVDYSLVTKQVGSFEAFIKSESNTKLKIRVVVYDENTIFDFEKDELIYAKDFAININEISNVSEADIIDMAQVYAIRISDNKVINPQVKMDLKNEIASYKVEILSEIQMNVRAVVKNEYTYIDWENDEVIYARDFFIKTNEFDNINDNLILSEINARAFTISSNSAVLLDVNKTKLINEFGSYPIELMTREHTIKEIRGVVIDEHSKVDTSQDIVIRSESFELLIDKVNSTLHDDYLDLANIKAFNISDNEIQSVRADYSFVIKELGSYAVSYSVPNRLTTSDKVIVVDESTIVDYTNMELIRAEKFYIDISLVPFINDSELIELASAKAIKLSDNSQLSINVKSMLEESINAHDITFYTNARTSITIFAGVTDENTSVFPGVEGIYARDVYLDKSKVALLDEDKFIDLAQIRVQDFNNNPLGFRVDYTNIEAEIGSYPVFVVSDNQNIHEFRLIVFDEHTTLEPADRILLHAKDFVIKEENVSSLSEEKVIELGHIRAIDWTNNTEFTNLKVDYSRIGDKFGSYTIRITTPNSTLREIKAVVIDEFSVYDLGLNEMLRAESFEITEQERVGLDIADILVRSKAQARNINDNSEIEININTRRSLNTKLKLSTVQGLVKEIDISMLIDNEVDLDAHTISFDGLGSRNYMPSILVENKTKVKLPRNQFEQDDGIFIGWAISKEAGQNKEVTYLNEELILVEKSMVLYAVFSHEKFTISFDGNGAKNTMNAMSVFAFQDVQLTKNEFINENKFFVGWATSLEDASSLQVKYLDEDTFIFDYNEDLVLYAIWDDIEYNLIFDANGGQNEMLMQTFHLNQLVSLPKNAFTKEGFYFAGWATSSTKAQNKEVSYYDGETIRLSESNDVILYAVWDNVEYKLNFERSLGEGNMESINLKLFEERKLPKNTFKIENGSFIGWATTHEKALMGLVEYRDEALFRLSKNQDTTLYAVYSFSKITIRFDSNNNSNELNEMQVFKNQRANLIENTFKYKHHTFRGWAYSQSLANDGVVNLVDKQEVVFEERFDFILFAVWEKEKYTLTYHSDSHTSGELPIEKSEFVVNDVVIIQNQGNLKKNGYSFVGWVQKDDSSNRIWKYQDKLIIKGNVELLAVWLKDNQNLDKNGNSLDKNDDVSKEVLVAKLPKTGNGIILVVCLLIMMIFSIIVYKRRLS